MVSFSVTAVVEEEFLCGREDGNRFDPFAVAIMRGSTGIGHIPRRILSVCSLFFAWMWLHYLPYDCLQAIVGDLVQGEFEVPCVLCFEGDDKRKTKAKITL